MRELSRFSGGVAGGRDYRCGDSGCRHPGRVVTDKVTVDTNHKEHSPVIERATVYVSLLNEGTDVWRPVVAEQIGPSLFRLLGPVPSEERWQFQPGEVVRCENRQLSDGLAWVAVESIQT
jgi:hypothetical protein